MIYRNGLEYLALEEAPEYSVCTSSICEVWLEYIVVAPKLINGQCPVCNRKSY